MAGLTIGADEKKKLMLLGGLLVAIVVVIVVLYSKGNKAGTTVPAAPTSPTGGAVAGAPPALGSTPGTGAARPVTAASAPGGITAASLVSVEDYRTDPFSNPLPVPPLPVPPPPPAPPVVLPSPVDIAPPGEFGGDPAISLPPARLRGLGSRPISNLPPIVPRRVAVAPTAPRFAPPGAQSGGGGILTSQNKRLSGVIIGDSVRALLEISNGDGVPPTTRVVQPGDEVDGIRILRLERVSEGGRTVTRLIVRENNQEQYVELKPAPQQQNMGEGGIGGMGGPGMPGAFPGGAPPAPNGRF